MYSRTRLVPRPVAALALLLAAAAAEADIVTDHSLVHVQGFGRSGSTALYFVEQTGAGNLDSATQAGSDASGFQGSGRAAVAPGSDRLLEARASSVGPGPSSGSSAFATAWSRALWKDAVSFADTTVDTLRFRFQLDGSLSVTDVHGGAFTALVSRAYMAAIGNGQSFDAPSGPPLPPTAGPGTAVLVEDLSSLFPSSNGHRTVVTSDWISPQLVRTSTTAFEYSFDGSFEVVSRRLSGAGLPAGGIFPLVAGFDVVASNRGGASTADFFGTLRLTGVSDASGNPIAFSLLRFESSPQPVPEPATYPMLLAGLMLVALRLRRQAAR
jgi:hypothetical protein